MHVPAKSFSASSNNPYAGILCSLKLLIVSFIKAFKGKKTRPVCFLVESS